MSALSCDATAGLQQLAARTMNLARTVQGQQIRLACGAHQAESEPRVLQESPR